MTRFPVLPSYKHSELPDPKASLEPSDENATEFFPRSQFRRTEIHSPVLPSHGRAETSLDGENAVRLIESASCLRVTIQQRLPTSRSYIVPPRYAEGSLEPSEEKVTCKMRSEVPSHSRTRRRKLKQV